MADEAAGATREPIPSTSRGRPVSASTHRSVGAPPNVTNSIRPGSARSVNSTARSVNSTARSSPQDPPPALSSPSTPHSHSRLHSQKKIRPSTAHPSSQRGQQTSRTKKDDWSSHNSTSTLSLGGFSALRSRVANLEIDTSNKAKKSNPFLGSWVNRPHTTATGSVSKEFFNARRPQRSGTPHSTLLSHCYFEPARLRPRTPPGRSAPFTRQKQVLTSSSHIEHPHYNESVLVQNLKSQKTRNGSDLRHYYQEVSLKPFGTNGPMSNWAILKPCGKDGQPPVIRKPSTVKSKR